MEKLAVRKAIHTVMYELDQDFQWYQKRTADSARKGKTAVTYVVREVTDAQIRMLAPVAPHMCEELWEILGEKEFLSLTPWPTPDESKIDIVAEEKEKLITSVLEDTQNILKATGATPKKVCYYVAAPWKWQAWLDTLEKSAAGKIVQKDVMKTLMAKPELRAKADKVSKFIGQAMDEINRMAEERKIQLLLVKLIDETQVLNEAEAFLGKELKAKIEVFGEEETERYDPKSRAQLAKPYRPAIFIE
jgi:leucyl-tRNA synthetase